MSQGEKSVRYPTTATTLAEVKQAVENCPPWACSKFVVEFKGEQLDYGHAANLVKQAGLDR